MPVRSKARAAPPAPRTGPKEIIRAARTARILEARLRGSSLVAIGRQENISLQRTHRIIADELERQVTAPLEMIRRLEAERLDRLMLGIFEAAAAGDIVRMDRVIKLMERRAALLGLDAPRLTVANVTAAIDVSVERENSAAEFDRKLALRLASMEQAPVEAP
jgi:hypothetical protein